MAPLTFQGSAAEAVEKIQQIVDQQFSRAKLITREPNYLHYEFTSLIFRFVDDVEFLVDDSTRQIHFRSASRVGYSDLGANRRRMTKFVQEFSR